MVPNIESHLQKKIFASLRINIFYTFFAGHDDFVQAVRDGVNAKVRMGRRYRI